MGKGNGHVIHTRVSAKFSLPLFPCASAARIEVCKSGKRRKQTSNRSARETIKRNGQLPRLLHTTLLFLMRHTMLC